MTAGILAIAAALIGLLVWWVKRRAERTPSELRRVVYGKIDKALGKADAAFVNAFLEHRLRDQDRGNSGRQDGAPAAGGPAVHAGDSGMVRPGRANAGNAPGTGPGSALNP